MAFADEASAIKEQTNVKEIFNETKGVGSYEKAYTRRYNDGTPDVCRNIISIHGSVKASFDKGTRTLVIDMAAYNYQEYDDYTSLTQRIFETQPSREAAIRSVIEHADGWYVGVLAGLPKGDGTMTDAEIIERSKKPVEDSELPY